MRNNHTTIMQKTHTNYKLVLVGLMFLFGALFVPGLLRGEGENGGCADYPNNPELCESNQGTPIPLPPAPGPITPGEDGAVDVTINPNFEIPKGEEFYISWGAAWSTHELESGKNIYTVTVSEGNRVLWSDSFDSEFYEQAPDSGSVYIPGGITQDTEYKVVGTVQQVTNGTISTDEAVVNVTIKKDDIELTECAIVAFSATPSRVNHGSGTTLKFTLKNPDNFSWKIQRVGTPNVDLVSGSGTSGQYETGALTTPTAYRLTCGTEVRSITVLLTETPPENGGGGGGWCGVEGSSSIGPRIPVSPDHVLLGTCWVGDYSNEEDVYGVDGATKSFTGNCVPPAGTDRIIANINMDDGGTMRVNGTQVYSIAPSCSIKNNDIEISNMEAGEDNSVSVTAVNSILGGVGADVEFYFYNTGSNGLLTPTISAPSCSDTSYNVQISWPPVNNNIRIFVDDNFNNPEGFDKVMYGSTGSTVAPYGFTQRIPGAPQTLTFEPGTTYYSFIQNDGPDSGPTVSWSVPMCTEGTLPAGSLSAVPSTCTIAEGAGSCTSAFSWNVTDPVGLSAITKAGNVQVTTGDVGGSVPMSVAWGGETFYLYNNSLELDAEPVNAVCEDTTVWNSSEGKCMKADDSGTCSDNIQNGNETGVDSGGRCGEVVGPGPFNVTVIKTAGGSVRSTADTKINCGASCSASYDSGSTVTLQAIPSSSYWKFAGWSGDCSGAGSCVLNVNGPKTATALFTPRQFNYQEF